MAEFVEEVKEEETKTEEEVVQEQPKVEEEIPEKYKGKSLSEIVGMHQAAEKLIGRQGSELGELRRVADSYIHNQAEQTKQTEQENNEDDFFTDPKKAVDKAIQNHPKIKQAEQASLEMQRAKALSALKEKHSDFADVVKEQGFQDWVNNSKVRSELFVRADRRYDYDAADELISLYKDRRETGKKTAEMEKQSRSQSVKTATTTVPSGSNEAPSKKIFRRSDLIRLNQTDPDKYDSMWSEIELAYKEGRVR
jgi:outer membrane biosynthesis protein TonB